jgi:hypothetical protein
MALVCCLPTDFFFFFGHNLFYQARHENTTVVYVGRPENVVAFANLLRLSDGAETWPSFSSYVAIEVGERCLFFVFKFPCRCKMAAVALS